MMTADDAMAFPEENFAPFEYIEDEIEDENSNHLNTLPKSRKKNNDFNFTSLWRKPKLGRRKMKTIVKSPGIYERKSPKQSNHKTTIGRYFKDRESFETSGSVPLSEFDEAKDTLPFLNFRTRFETREAEGIESNPSSSRILKDKVALNPKLFLTPAPTTVQDAKPTIESDRLAHEKSNSNEPCADFDPFQTLSKESPNKPPKPEAGADKKKEELVSQNNKQDAFEDWLYNDHGPILSSLSEDTIFSDSIRGERFLEDNFNEDTIGTGLEGDYKSPNKTNRKNINQVTSRLSNPDDKKEGDEIETSVRSFSDRLKLFQSKGETKVAQPTSNLSKQQSQISLDNLAESGNCPLKSETVENIENSISKSICGSDITSVESNISENECCALTTNIEDERQDSENTGGKRNSPEMLSFESKQLSLETETNEENCVAMISSQSDHSELKDSSSGKKYEGRETIETKEFSAQRTDSWIGSEENRDCSQNISDVSSLTMSSNGTARQYASKFGVTLSRRNLKSDQDQRTLRSSEYVSHVDTQSRDELEGTTINVVGHIKPTVSDFMKNTSKREITRDTNYKEHVSEDCGKDKCVEMTKKDQNEQKSLKEGDEVDTDPHALQINSSSPNSDANKNNFAQKSASMFGVTLSKTRNRNTNKLSPDISEASVRNKVEKIRTSLERESFENKAKRTSGEWNRSRASSSWKNADGNKKNSIPETNEQVESSLIPQGGSIGQASNQGIESGIDMQVRDQLKPCVFKRNKISLSDRRKMFEAEGISVENNRKKSIESATCAESPRSLTSSLGDLTVKTVVQKRRIVQSKTKPAQTLLHEARRSSITHDDDNSDNGLDDIDDGIGSNRRKTLVTAKKVLGTYHSSLGKRTSNHSHEPDVLVRCKTSRDSDEFKVDSDKVVIQNARKSLESIQKEKKNVTETQQMTVNKVTPTKVGYSARKNFFENLNQSRVQLSMSRPLVGKDQSSVRDTATLATKHTDERVHDHSPLGDKDLPMFVTVEEDFLLKDNISTCLSASENRSVVCKPDPLLYSVSQKAMALMASKTSKETITNDSNQKKATTQNFILKRQESLRKMSKEGCRREPNASKEVAGSNNERTVTDDKAPQHQLYNRVARKKVSSQFHRHSIAQKETDDNKSTEDTSGNEPKPKNESLEKIQRYNNFAKTKDSNGENEEESNISNQPSFHRFKYSRFKKIGTKPTSPIEPKREQPSTLRKEGSHNAGAEDEKGPLIKPSNENKDDNEVGKAAPAHRFKFNRFTKIDVAPTSQTEPKREDVGNTDTEDDKDVSIKASTGNERKVAKSKVAPSHRFKYSRFTKNDTALASGVQSIREHPSRSEIVLDEKERADSEALPLSEKKERNQMNKTNDSHRFKYNRFTKKDAPLDQTVEPKEESELEDDDTAQFNAKQKQNKTDASLQSLGLKCNRFNKKPLNVDSKEIQDGLDRTDDENNEALTETQEAQTSNSAEQPEASSQPMARSMSIRERRKFFESQSKNYQSSRF